MDNNEVNKIFEMLLKRISKIDMLIYQLCILDMNDKKDNEEYDENLELLQNEINKIKNIYKKRIFNDNNVNGIYKELDYRINSIQKPYNRKYIRMMLELEANLDKELLFTYDRDIMAVAFHLLDQSIDNLKNDELKRELIKQKYDIAMRCPCITQDCIDNRFNFNREIYDCTDMIATVRKYRLNPIENHTLEEYALSVIDIHGIKLLSVTDEVYRNDIKLAAEALIDYYMVASAMSFLSYDLTLDYFEEKIKRHDISEDAYSYKLLKALIGSKQNTRKRINKVSFYPFE